MPGTVSSFKLYSITFHLRAEGRFAFPSFLAGNVLRGALGSFLRSANPKVYEILFGRGPEVSQITRPFVLRCRNLESREFFPGEPFSFQLNLFLSNLDLLDAITAAVLAMGDKGFGPNRSRASLLTPAQFVQHSLPLESPADPVSVIRIHFKTPTELKDGGKIIEPGGFAILMAHIQRRLNHLSALYGEGELAIDRKLLGKQADSVQLDRTDLRRIEVSRRGSRYGLTHTLGGFIGSADYSGNLSPFIPLLEIASFTAVGRHTVWGNGEISTEILG